MAVSTRYGKIVDGEFVSAPLNMFVNGVLVCNVFCRPELLEAEGYKPVRSDAYPALEDGQEAEPSYSDEGDYIRESWAVRDGEVE